MATTTDHLRPTGGVQYTASPISLTMDKYRFLYVVQELLQQERRVKPLGQYPWVALTIFLALMIPVLTSTFQNKFHIDGSVWSSITLIFAGLALLATAGLAVWWIIDRCTHVERTSVQIYDEVVAQMARDDKEASAHP